MENNMQPLSCEIVKDLLPLYHDKVVNEVTEDAVKKHLDICAACAREYAGLCRELPEETDASGASKIFFESWRQKLKKKQNQKMALTAGIACLAVIALMLELCHDPLIPVKVKNMKIQQMYEVERTDGSRVLYVRAEMPLYRYASTCNVKLLTRTDHTDLKITARIALPELFSRGEKNIVSEFFTIPMDVTSDQKIIQEIFYDGELVWTKGQNDKADIPPYVMADVDPEGENVDSVSWSFDNIEVTYNDGKRFSWTPDGDIRSEHYEKGAEDKYFNGTVLAVQEEHLLLFPNSDDDLARETGFVLVSVAPLKATASELLSLLETGDHIRVRYHNAIKEEDCVIADADRIALGWSFAELP